MNMAMKMTAAFLDAQKIKYQVDEERNVIRTGSRAKNKPVIEVIIVFDSDTSIGIRSFNYCTFPEDKTAKIYEACSQANKKFRWVKFFVDEEDHTVTLADDAVIQVESCGEEIMELLVRLIGIADEAYPDFMKAIWS